MKKYFILYCFFTLHFLVGTASFYSDNNKNNDNAVLILDFDGSLYPPSLISIFREKAMEVWGDLHQAHVSFESQCSFKNNLDLFLDKLLHLYVQAHVLTEDKVNFSAKEDGSCGRLVTSLESMFDRVMINERSDQASCAKVLFQKIQKKMERIFA